MKLSDQTVKASIDVKHLDPAFYLKGIKQVIDPVIKGLKTEVKVKNAGAYVYLKSEMQVTRLEKRKTIRAVWWNGKHDLPITSKELLQIKIKADQWYSDNNVNFSKNRSNSLSNFKNCSNFEHLSTS
ncbi:hypothetical protein [Succinimonas sp.]|uniref:hypothetical protein n=1 Tax=Succinimonas sp. TaxID=1936151 RepID=UPI0038672F54